MTGRQLLYPGLLALILLASACDLAPFYHRPALPLPPQFKEQAGWHAAAGDRKIEPANWWTLFNDANLNTLETKLPGNQNLKAALARYDEASAALAIATAGLLPTVNGEADVTRQRDSKTTKDARSSQALAAQVAKLSGANGSAGGSSAYNDYTLGLNASYDLDVFGRLRNAVAAAGDEAEASRDDLAAFTLMLQAQLAESYFTIRVADAQVDILTRAAKNYQEQLDVVNRRHQVGIAVAADVDEALVQLKNANADLDDARLRRAQGEHALAVLIGLPPSGFTLPPAPFKPTLAPVPAGVPSQLLERRPDIAAAERRVAEANDEIGIARAAWFPDITLTGTLGFESETLAHLISAPSLFWSVGPQVAQTVFDGGKIAAQVAQAEASYKEAAANYRQTVLSALQDVEDNLAGVRQYGAEAGDRNEAAAAADRSVAQAIRAWRGGIDTYVNVTVQENNALQAHLSLAQAQLSQITANIRLIQALGGGQS